MKQPKGKPSEIEVIRKMRVALDLLKEKWQEAEGTWAMLDFMTAANDESHWMHVVIEAEQLSKPYLLPKKAKTHKG